MSTNGLSSLRVIVALVFLLLQACSSPSPNRLISLQMLANTASATSAAEDMPPQDCMVKVLTTVEFS